jgi:hypothetical protein
VQAGPDEGTGVRGCTGSISRLAPFPRSERILKAELDEHLEEERADGNANRRNGHSQKTVLTGTSKMQFSIPRTRSRPARDRVVTDDGLRP